MSEINSKDDIVKEGQYTLDMYIHVCKQLNQVNSYSIPFNHSLYHQSNWFSLFLAGCEPGTV